MSCYYYKKAWWDRPRYDAKLAEQVDVDYEKPKWRPGWWVAFRDPVCMPDLPAVVGQVYYVSQSRKGVVRYFIQHGCSLLKVKESDISTRMVESS